jgi:ABC-2 type transport system ATP-binding protein
MVMTSILATGPTGITVVHSPSYGSTPADRGLTAALLLRKEGRFVPAPEVRWPYGVTVMDVLDAERGAALVLRGLVKRFDTVLAVGGVDLDVPVGSFYGLLGPNGAGKTTTLSMAVGLLRPDHGNAYILGHDVWADPVEAKRRVGVLPDGVRMFDRLTGAELLAYTGLLRGMDPAVTDQRALELLDVFGLADAGRNLVVDYSAGMKKKIGLACALLHAPRLLVLDEPFEAVDPVSGALIRDILQRYVHGGGTVIFSSHVMETVERLCSHVAILTDGVIKTAGTLADVRGGRDMEDVFVEIVGGRVATGEELSWL